jgi:hypothetical protein
MQRTQQSSFSNSFFTLSYGKCWEVAKFLDVPVEQVNLYFSTFATHLLPIYSCN